MNCKNCKIELNDWEIIYCDSCIRDNIEYASREMRARNDYKIDSIMYQEER